MNTKDSIKQRILCKKCNSDRTKKNGRNKTNAQRYKCGNCGSHFADGGKPVGGQLIGDLKLTNAEKQKRWYDSLSDERRKEVNHKRNESRGKRKKCVKPCPNEKPTIQNKSVELDK